MDIGIDVNVTVDGILEKFDVDENGHVLDEPYERVHIKNEEVVKIERKGVDY